MSTLGLFLLAIVAPSPAVPAPEPRPETAAAIKLWLDSGREFRQGERARVQVETQYDGYLIVLNYDTDGRIRVLFPISPRDDQFIRAGRRYEVEGRGDRESFLVGGEGEGLVFAAVSPDPFDLRDFQTGGNWDYNRLYVDRDSPDPEADITELLQRASSDRGFDYDLVDYRVWGYRDVAYGGSVWYPRPYGFYDDFYCDPWFRPSLFGCRYWWPGTRFGFGVGFYSPYRYGYGYGYGYPYGYGYGYGWWRNSVYGGGVRNYNWPVVVGRPRGYTIVRRRPNNTVVGRAPGSFGGGSIGGVPGRYDGRPRYDGRARPTRDDRPAAGRPDNRRPDARPSADDRGRTPTRDGRPRARPANPRSPDRPIVERDRGDRRAPVEVNDRPRARPSDDRPRGRPADDRPAVVPDAPRRADVERRPEVSRPPERSRRVDVPVNREPPRAPEARPQQPRAPEARPQPERPRSNDRPPPRVEAPSRRSDPAPRSAPSVDVPRDNGARSRVRPPARRASPRASAPPPRSASPRTAPSRPSSRAMPSRPSSRATPSRPSPRAAPSRPSPRAAPSRPSRPARASAPRSSPPRVSRPSSSSGGSRPRSRPKKP